MEFNEGILENNILILSGFERNLRCAELQNRSSGSALVEIKRPTLENTLHHLEPALKNNKNDSISYIHGSRDYDDLFDEWLVKVNYFEIIKEEKAIIVSTITPIGNTFSTYGFSFYRAREEMNKELSKYLQNLGLKTLREFGPEAAEFLLKKELD